MNNKVQDGYFLGKIRDASTVQIITTTGNAYIGQILNEDTYTILINERREDTRNRVIMLYKSAVESVVKIG